MVAPDQPSILVTGGAGYIGSHVCKALDEAGYLPERGVAVAGLFDLKLLEAARRTLTSARQEGTDG